MRIVAISDLHGELPEDLPDGDTLLIAGDICPDFDVKAQAAWLDVKVRPWLHRLRERGFRHIIVIAGNHDFVFAQDAYPKDLPWTYLCDSGVQVEGRTFWGTPWQPLFAGWAFEASERGLQERFSLIPDDSDVVIAHGPPYGVLDRTYNDINAGSKAMLKALDRVRPALIVFGHIHEARGVASRRLSAGDGADPHHVLLANVSMYGSRGRAVRVFDLVGVPAQAAAART